MIDVSSQIKQIRSLLNLGQISADDIENLNIQLNRIEKRTKDRNIYIGLIGEFSSGKSTLINSLIGSDFFVTNALQGTTTTPTFIQYGNHIDLIVQYKSGKKLSYSRNKKRLLKRYLPHIYDNLSFAKKLAISLKSLFGQNSYDDTLLTLFDHVTTSDAASEYIDFVRIYYPTDILKNGIVIVDTPGTDSLNPEHTKTTKRTIRDVCDLAFVIMPQDKLLSHTLSGFIDDNFTDEIKRKCYYLITKAELVKTDSERTGLMKGLSRRLTAMNEIENPKIYLAPSLLSLEYNGILEPTGLLTHLSDSERKALAEGFKKDIDSMIFEINSTKAETIQHKINLLVQSLTASFSDSLNNKKLEIKQEVDTLERLRTIPLARFMEDFFVDNEAVQAYYSVMETKIVNEINDVSMSFYGYLANNIDNAETKDAVQRIMRQPETKAEGNRQFENCYHIFMQSVKWLRNYYEENFNEFKQSFTEAFSIQAIDFNFSVKIKTSWMKKYKFSFNSSKITTFKLIRAFKSLDSIKNQMKSAVFPQIKEAFGKVSTHYVDKIKNINASLIIQLEKVKAIFFKKYEKVINKKIAAETIKINRLSEQIEELEQSIRLLNDRKAHVGHSL